MAMKLNLALCIISLLTIIFTQSLGTPLNLNTICENTLHEDFCKYILPPNNKYHTVFDYSKISIQHSLSNARSFLDSINRFLETSTSLGTVQALEDCRFLAGQNVNFLSKVSERINSEDSINSFEADDLHHLLSAALTNLETCFEGLEAVPSASSIKDSLFQSNGTKSFSVSLELSRHWDHHHDVSTKYSRKLQDHVSRSLIDKISKPHKKKAPKKKEIKCPFDMLWNGNITAIYEFATGKRDIKHLQDGNIGVKQMVMVSPRGDGHFKTINDAIAAAPNNTGDSGQYFAILVVNGVYEEYISIPEYKQNLILIGDNYTNPPIITGNRSVGDGASTFNSATFSVDGKNFIAVDMKFRNTAGPSKKQAVAVRNGADKSIFYRCYFEGYQNTLYVQSFRQFYGGGEISGTVDFIFGNAAVVFQQARIIARLPLPRQNVTITAQGRTNPSQKTGISIDLAEVVASRELVESLQTTNIYLGRPMKKYSRTVYMRSQLDGLIEPEGWIEWDGDFGLSTLYYGEFANHGYGALDTDRVKWPGYHNMTIDEAKNFTVARFIEGKTWLPATGIVPYYGKSPDTYLCDTSPELCI